MKDIYTVGSMWHEGRLETRTKIALPSFHTNKPIARRTRGQQDGCHY